MHLHVFIPGLFTPLPLWQQDFAFEPQAPALLKLLAAPHPGTFPVQGLERSLLHWLGMDASRLVPWAQLRHHFESGGMYQPPLLCADPVHMQTGIDAVILSPEQPRLEREEVELLFATLNEHLAEDGLVFKAFNPQRWYLYPLDESFSHALPETTPLSELGGDNIFPKLPQSDDSYWQRLLNEIQMLLHDHPVNRNRAANSQQTVNSVWFWGEGDVPEGDSRTVHVVNSGGITGQVIAHHCDGVWHPQQIPNRNDLHRENLLILDQLQTAALLDQPERWQRNMFALEACFVFLSEVLEDGGVVTIYDAAGNYWACDDIPGWQFWRARQAEWHWFL